MAKKTSKNIVRPAGDTYPSKSTIKVGGVPVNLSGWNVDVRYKKDDVEWIINCVVTNSKEGKVNIYPHARRKSEMDGTRMKQENFRTIEATTAILNGYTTGTATKIGLNHDGSINNGSTIDKVLVEVKPGFDSTTTNWSTITVNEREQVKDKLVNQVWDENEAYAKYPFYLVRWKEFPDGYVEEMTHSTGFIILTSRFPA